MNEDDVVIDPGTNLLIETLEKRWRTFRGELKRCTREPSEGTIHDLRVVTRRLLALVDMLKALDPHPRLQKLRSDLKNQLDILDDLRDTQVMLVEVSETLEDLPELTLFQEYLIKREKRLMRSAMKAIRSFNSSNIRKRLDAARKDLFKTENGNDLKKELLQIVDEAYGTTVRRYQNIEPSKPATIHRVRVAFKKFRYMVELVYPLIPNFPEGNLQHMHDYQGLMGDIQDVEVFLTSFTEFADKDSSYDSDSVQQHFKQRHSKVVRVFVEDMHHLNVFWRAGPSAPFPWEIRRSSMKAETSQEPDSAMQIKEDEIERAA